MNTVESLVSPTRQASVSDDRQLLGQVATLFAPLALATGVSSAINVSDVYLTGLVGAESQAAVGIGDQILFLSVMLGTGLATACTSFVSRAVGAGQLDEARTHAGNALVVAVLTGLVATAVGVMAAPALVLMFGASPAVVEQAVPYIQLCSLANIPYMLLMSLTAIMRALSSPKDALLAWMITSVLTIGGSFALFFAPTMFQHSLLAIALSWVVGAFAGMALGLYLLAKRLPGCISFDLVQFSKFIKPMAMTTAPAVMSELFMVMSNIAVFRLLSLLPESAHMQAALAVRLRLEQVLAVVPLLALAYASEVIVGQTVGSGDLLKARSACVRIAIGGSLALLVLGAAVSFAAPLLSSLFCPGQEEAQALLILLSAAIIVLPCTAVIMLLCAGLDARGFTHVSMLVNFVLFLLRVGAAAVSVCFFQTGMAGLSFSGCAAAFLAALVAVYCFRRNFMNAETTWAPH